MQPEFTADFRGIEVVSVVPGRIRVRAARRAGTAEQLEALAGALEPMAGVREVRLRASAASAVVEFEPDQTGTVLDGLSALGIGAPGASEAPAEADTAAVIRIAAQGIDRAVAGRAAGADLRLLVPLGLGLLSLRKALLGDDRLADAPWYLLAWYASETFFRFHGRPASDQRAGNASEET